MDGLDLGLEQLYLQVLDLLVLYPLPLLVLSELALLLHDLGLYVLEGDLTHHESLLAFLQLTLVHFQLLDQSHLLLILQLGLLSELEVLNFHLSHTPHLHLYLLVHPLFLLEEMKVFPLGLLGELLGSLESLL